MKKTANILVVLLMLAIVITACTTTPSGNSISNIPAPKDEDPSTPIQDVSVFIVKGAFEPSQITVKKDIPVRLTLTVKDIDPKFDTHGFAIKELNVNEKIKVGETKVVEFTPTTAGTFVYYCSVFCGEGHLGQTGILHVV
jgi:cytochrome c oxidase subunit II